jgi:hypothetical protein
MIKVKDGVATREPVPDFLASPDSPEAIAALADLSWTDPALGVTDCVWWPEESADGELGTNKKWGAEVLTLDADRKVVIVTHKQVAMTAAEKAARDAAIAEQAAAAQAATVSTFEHAVQAKLDGAAVAARYDSIATAVSYAEEPAVPKFQNDGIAFRAWRSLVWAYAYEQLAKVLAGEREQPTVGEFLLELPVLELPA